MMKALLLILVIHLQCISATAPGRPHFQTFYHQLRPYMHKYLSNDCKDVYDRYLHDPDFTSENTLDCPRCATAAVTSCLLNTFEEVDKANMASAAVILGVLPATLSLASSSTAETGLLSLRRPLLAFLIAAGSPAVSPIRTFNYGDPEELIEMRHKALRPPKLGRRWSLFVLIAECVIALTAVTNLGIVSYQICVRTICAFAQDTAYMPAMWCFLAALIHLCGALAVTSRVRLEVPHPQTGIPMKRRLGQKIREECTLSKNQCVANLAVKDEGAYFLILSWCTSSGTVAHIIFGTLVFSSILFITTLDALTVVFQFLGSTIVCRALLMYELAGMRQITQVRQEKEKDECECDGERRDDWRRSGLCGKGEREVSGDVPLIEQRTLTLVAPESTKSKD